MSKALLEARNISKTFGEGHVQVRAVASANLTLKGGELTLLMGPSGSGKTTLLSILGCMLTPGKGTLAICGNPVEKAGPERLAEIRRSHIGFIFQSYHLFPTLTAAENIQLALDIRGQNGSEAANKSHKLLEKVGLSRKSKAFPREMSGGEQQRVAIARAIVANPSVILADEPTAALDTSNGRAVMNILSELAEDQNSAVLAVSHDSRVIPFADRIIYIEDGVLKHEDPAAQMERKGARQRKN
ncbi:ABC transporter ATP-binding protein [Pseudorhodoplanes sp.]|jgi:putative ABC transport system ATP-binding protein|uniref:ABC transporter ATP-binding protein n=1 Tax=Pseudorhodoplanes sp. TaxID=1934341 RepID=UPI002CD163AA|nr:ABC transporter ATP-binding protein [Pseudorhodoplanes sp.]HWK87939.1 ABC transporter ATP-binding protein [Xanthobacteraceae bacterium]HWV41164.1 ABC transporter ATP-binding protein [Pseudorhodoplanes sp.]